MTFGFFSRKAAGQPAVQEVLLMGLIGEELAIQSRMTYDTHFSKGVFPLSCRFNPLVRTEKRKECEVYDLIVYETHLNTINGVAFLSMCLKGGDVTIMAQGRRSGLDRVSKLSEYPHLERTVERACTEYEINAGNLVWRIY
jgi:hypothetical protein